MKNDGVANSLEAVVNVELMDSLWVSEQLMDCSYDEVLNVTGYTLVGPL